jgi:hypothetical protein
MDEWNGWALRLGGGSAYMCGYNGSAWTIDIEITAPHGTPYRFFQHAANGALVDEWILSKRLDGGSGTGASPATYGGAIGHVDTSLVWSWVDFPKNEELTSAAFTEKEQWVVGRGGIVYRCLQPGCELAKSAPPGG